MIRQSHPIPRYTPVKRKRSKPRKGPMRDPGYLAFLREYGMCAASYPTFFPMAMSTVRGCAFYACEAAHGPVNGMSSKGPDNEAIPLSPEKHREQHKIGWAKFEAKYGFSRSVKAAEWYAVYLESKGKP